MNINAMTKSEIKGLSLEEIKMLLKKEWDTCIINDNARITYHSAANDQKQIYMDILNLYFTLPADMEWSNIDPNYPYIAKSNWSILAALTEHTEEDFKRELKVLYTNGYLQKLYVDNMDRFSIEDEFDESFYQSPIDFIIPHESNLKWIYNKYSELFNISVLSNSDDQFLIDMNGHFFHKDDTPEMILEKMIGFGTEVDLLCSTHSCLSLSDRGMYLLHLNQYNQNLSLIKQQQSIIHELQISKEKQEELLDKINSTENKITNMYERMQKEVRNHRNKIELFYKDITTILSILVAAFSVIGLNISAIPKIDNNFAANILTINLSLILVLITLFFLLKSMVFQFPGEKSENSWKWGAFAAIIIMLLYFILFYSGAFHSPISKA